MLPSQAALERVWEGLFALDVEAIRDFYASEEELFTHVVAFLDRHDGAGWTLLQALLSRAVPVDIVLQSAQPFFAERVESSGL